MKTRRDRKPIYNLADIAKRPNEPGLEVIQPEIAPRDVMAQKRLRSTAKRMIVALGTRGLLGLPGSSPGGCAQRREV